MSLDMRLLTVSDETADSDGSESISVGLSGPLGCNWPTDPAGQPRTSPLSRGTRFDGCRMQRVRP